MAVTRRRRVPKLPIPSAPYLDHWAMYLAQCRTAPERLAALEVLRDQLVAETKALVLTDTKPGDEQNEVRWRDRPITTGQALAHLRSELGKLNTLRAAMSALTKSPATLQAIDEDGAGVDYGSKPFD